MQPGALGREIERLPGVLAATVFAEPPDRARVYLAVDDGVDATAVRATCLALLRDAGFEIDPERVHIGTAPAPTRVPTTLPPLTLDGLDVHRADSQVTCAVRLRSQGRTFSATVTEPDTPAGPARAAARATLAAAENLNPDLRLGLHGVRRADLFGFDALTVLVDAAFGRGNAQLPGTVLLDRSLEHAGALAALQALRSWTP